MLKKSCSWKILMIHIFFVRMYHHIKLFMTQATYECEHNLGIHRHLLTNNYSQQKNRRDYEKMLFSKQFAFNPSMLGLRDNNPSPSGTFLVPSRFVLATCINFMGFVLYLLGVVCFAEGGIQFINCVKLQISVCYSLNLRKKRKKSYPGMPVFH